MDKIRQITINGNLIYFTKMEKIYSAGLEWIKLLKTLKQIKGFWIFKQRHDSGIKHQTFKQHRTELYVPCRLAA